MSTKPGFLIAGNWKMNKGPADAAALAADLRAAIGTPGCGVVVCPPFVSLVSVQEALAGSGIAVGAQNCHFEDSGAFTGEVSAAMLVGMGVAYVILGHSERRTLFGETDTGVARRLTGVLNAGLKPIVCVGETLEQREAGTTEAVLETQLRAAFESISRTDVLTAAVAYEPVWAIGTGRTATEPQAEETCAYIRGWLAERFSADTADRLQILYGGSMNAGNAAGLLACPNINGGLIGGAALKPADFAAIVEAACKAGV